MRRSSLLFTYAALSALALGCGDQPPTTAPSEPSHEAVKQRRFSATPIGNADGTAAEINEAGQVVGTKYFIRDGVIEGGSAFLWDKGTMTELAIAPGVQGSGANGINNRGQIVGVSPGSGGSETGFPHAVLWDRGTITDLGALPGAVYSQSGATAINERGQIVGYSSSSVDFGSDHAVVWKNGKITDLGAPPQGASYATDINNRAEIVGSSQAYDAYPHATLWSKGTTTDLGLLPAAVYSNAHGINDRGQVVGVSGNPNPEAWEHAVIWERGTMTDLGTLPGGSHSFAFDINAAGVVAGMSDAGDGQFHAVIWQRGVIRDLGVGEASGINNRGQVVGTRDLRPTLWSVK